MLSKLAHRHALRALAGAARALSYSRRQMDIAMLAEDGNQAKADTSIKPRDVALQFSKEPIMENYGELAPGEIPEPLKFVAPFEKATLDNGLRVCSENWQGMLTSVGVFIKAGSRNETLDTSGTAHFLEHLNFKGTAKRTRTQLEVEIENMGAHLNAYTTREYTCYYMVCFPWQLKKCLEILGDILQNSLYRSADVQAERSTILTELEEVNKDQQEVLLENVYYNAFRDHMMGQPILGSRENINNVTEDMIREFHANHYHGSNMVIVGTGNLDHKQLVDFSEKYFGTLPKDAPAGFVPRNTERAVFTPALMFVRDDEMVNSNVGIFFDAPGWTHEDYYGFLLFQRIIGNYEIAKNDGHINDPGKQYNTNHVLLGSLPDVTIQNCHYAAYSDSGLFGSYLFGNEVFTRAMNLVGLHIPATYGTFTNEVEVFRARNKVYDELLTIQSPQDVLQQIGPQIMYLDRRVPRSEIAKRVSYMDGDYVRHLAMEWFYDAEPSVTNWGPIETVSAYGSYKYFKAHTMTSVTQMNLPLQA